MFLQIGFALKFLGIKNVELWKEFLQEGRDGSFCIKIEQGLEGYSLIRLNIKGPDKGSKCEKIEQSNDGSYFSLYSPQQMMKNYMQTVRVKKYYIV